MKAPRLTDRDRRALLLGALVLAPALSFTLGVRPYVATLTSARQALDAQRDLLRREIQLLRESEVYPEMAHRAERALRTETPRLFDAPDALSANGALAAYVRERAREHRVLIQQTESKSARPAGRGVLAVEIEIRAQSDLEGHLSFLHALENGPKLVRVEQIGVDPGSRFGFGGSRAQEVLSLSAVISGYALSEEAGATERAREVREAAASGGAP